MLISIFGDVIDTKDIYMVTKLEYDIEVNVVRRFYFNILLYNRKELYISLLPYSMSWYKEHWFSENYEEKFEDMKNKISTLRDKIIEYWQENKSDIPQLEF